MATVIRCGVTVIGLLVVAAGIAAENTAVVPKSAIGALVTQLDNISRDRDVTTAKKAIVAADAEDKFNQQYKGKLLTVRLKVQDVVPYSQGQYLTANSPDLDGLQFNTAKFQANLSNAEVMSVTKDSVLVVTGKVSAATQSQPNVRSSDIVKPGSSIVFPLRASPGCRICLDNVSYQLEVAPKTKLDVRPASSSSSSTPADKAKNEQSRSVDDVKLFFLKGIVQKPGSTNTGATGKAGTGQTTGSNSSSASGSAKVKRNRTYTAAEIIQKFGNPSSRTSKATSEEWVYKCSDGVVHVHFTQVGVARSSSTSNPETLKLEIESVDSSSSPSAGTSRF